MKPSYEFSNSDTTVQKKENIKLSSDKGKIIAGPKLWLGPELSILLLNY